MNDLLVWSGAGLLALCGSVPLVRMAWQEIRLRRWAPAARAYVLMLLKDQYLPASQDDVAALLSWAERRRAKALVQEQLALVASQNATTGLRRGHLWLISWKARGLVSADLPMPSCADLRHGIETIPSIKEISDRVGEVALMKSWVSAGQAA